MIEVFARRNASNVLPVMWTIGELEIPHRRHDVGGSFEGTRTPDYLALNPNGKIPTLRDGTFVLWESNAIVRYLCRRYDKSNRLLPPTEETYALADQWMDWYKTTLYPPYIDLFWAIVRTEPALRNEALIADRHRTTQSALQVLDDHLAETSFVVADRFTMADVPMGSLIYRYFSLEIDRPEFPGIDAWYKRLSERPAYQKHVMFQVGTNPGEWYQYEREPI